MDTNTRMWLAGAVLRCGLRADGDKEAYGGYEELLPRCQERGLMHTIRLADKALTDASLPRSLRRHVAIIDLSSAVYLHDMEHKVSKAYGGAA